MLRGAQNTAFVGLICDNIRLELQQKPWQVSQVLTFLMKEVPKANSDFTRLKLAEGLVPLLSEFQNPEFITSCLMRASTNDKKMKKLTESLMCIDVNSPESERAYFSFADMLKSNKNFMADLLQHYNPLLAELNLADQQ